MCGSTGSRMGGLDFESIRHRVKLRRDTGEEQLYENRDDVSCPVCGTAFSEALATSERRCQLSPPAGVDICIVREEARTVVFTHAPADGH
ncbi:DUF7385 family protein [Halobacterium bonnevillei]